MICLPVLNGVCAFDLQVVPDVAPGFNVASFYDPIVEQRREEVAAQVKERKSRLKSGQR